MKISYLLVAVILVSLPGLAQLPDVQKGRVYLTGFIVIDNFNSGSVANNPSGITTFTLSQYSKITAIQTYHWNNGKGILKLGTIKLTTSDGKVYGPWTAKGSVGHSGVLNVFWTVYPNLELPPGTYTIVDSDNSTWSYNAQSLNKGFAKVNGMK